MILYYPLHESPDLISDVNFHEVRRNSTVRLRQWFSLAYVLRFLRTFQNELKPSRNKCIKEFFMGKVICMDTRPHLVEKSKLRTRLCHAIIYFFS